jgi:hypothetical protein
MIVQNNGCNGTVTIMQLCLPYRELHMIILSISICTWYKHIIQANCSFHLYCTVYLEWHNSLFFNILCFCYIRHYSMRIHYVCHIKGIKQKLKIMINHFVLFSMYYAWQIVHCLLFSMHCSLCIMHCAYIVLHALQSMHYAFCIMCKTLCFICMQIKQHELHMFCLTIYFNPIFEAVIQS